MQVSSDQLSYKLSYIMSCNCDIDHTNVHCDILVMHVAWCWAVMMYALCNTK